MSSENDKTLIFDAAAIQTAVCKIADSIYAEFFSERMTEIAFLGIQTGGIPLARRIAKIIRERNGYDAPIGMIDISMYRDDFGTRRTLPMIRETYIPFDLNGKNIILTDDVLQTGRSIRAALDAITDYGRPSLIRLATLIDRGLREFPIRADYVGGIVSVPRERRIRTDWNEYNLPDSVYSTPRTKPSGV